MRAILGVVSLLVALAVVGLLAVSQLRAVGHVSASLAPDKGQPAGAQMAASGTVREQAQVLENRVANDVVKAMNQGAEARSQEADKQ